MSFLPLDRQELFLDMSWLTPNYTTRYQVGFSVERLDMPFDWHQNATLVGFSGERRALHPSLLTAHVSPCLTCVPWHICHEEREPLMMWVRPHGGGAGATVFQGSIFREREERFANQTQNNEQATSKNEGCVFRKMCRHTGREPSENILSIRTRYVYLSCSTF